MRSRVIHLDSSRASSSTLGEATNGSGNPHLVLAWLPPDDLLGSRLAELASTWPESYRLGCETAGQFGGDRESSEGCLQLFWFERPSTQIWAELLRTPEPGSFSRSSLDALAPRILRSDLVLIFADGDGFPIEELLESLNERFDASVLPAVAGGCASRPAGRGDGGTRVFRGLEVGKGACLFLGLQGVTAEIQILRGWEAASPLSTVTRAAGRQLVEIDGVPAATWFAHFFTVDGRLAPMPESSWRFPLMIEGPGAERRGLYRSLRRLDEAAGIVELSGDVRVGDQVRLGMGDVRSLLEAAEQLRPGMEPEAAMMFSCLGRRSVLGEYGQRRERRFLRKALGLLPVGFHDFGEIGPTTGGPIALYNQTATLTLLAERGEEE